ncbi:hypothetical protein J3R30DRAFT_3401186 [Lentinula aciculospora]|uniref:HMG box domain-containing protein n=1 Tax=Lentinula aciculospora TaxID=153920 RepID=A0A9W9DT97_9AGAR|nr:hypothetical protein J3R30DRAFT_3401186 [Lentinula aciculospora]
MPLQLFGWTPSNGSALVQDDFSFHHRSNTDYSELWATSPDSCSSSYEEEHDTDNVRPRKGDPNWVARPKNAFIIFRCEYAKKNARGTGTVGGKRGLPPVDKTMSKRAGDEWKKLSKSQKFYYRQLADQEKRDHALAHPGYRYRPRRAFSSQRPHCRGGNRAGRTSQSMDSRLESSTTPSDDNVDYSLPAVQVPQPAVEPSSRFLKRRSISVPLPPLLLTSLERLEIRRTKSGVLTPPSPTSSPGSSFSTFDMLYPDDPNHDSALELGPPVPASEPKLSVPSYSTPLETVSSSLADWNGLVAPPLDQIASTSPLSESLSTPPSWVVTPPSEVDYQMYNTQAPYWSPSISAENEALHNYNVGLMDQLTLQDYLLFDTPVAEEQRIFEGFCHF